MRRHPRNMPTAAAAIEISDDFDEVIFLIWSLPSAKLLLWACRAQDMKVKVSFYCPRGSDH
jgi:hypothetical protein